MTNDQIELAATDHASKYPEHLRTDIVLHYGLGIVRGLKEGSNGEGTIYVPTPISQNPEKDGWYMIMFPEGESITDLNREYYFKEGDWFENGFEIESLRNKEHDTIDLEVEKCRWLRPTALPQELAAKDKEIEKRDKEIADMKATIERMAERLQEMAQDAIKAQGHN